MTTDFIDERSVFLSTLPPGHIERRLSLWVVVASITIFLAVAPFAKTPLAQVWAFIPIYESVLIINDLITAVLLFGQFSILRSKAICALASGYLFTAFIIVAHALTFPGLFATTGLLGAGPQSTAWLYMFWHGGFPIFIIAYALLKGREKEAVPTGIRTGVAIPACAAIVLTMVLAITLLATAGQRLLPAIMQGNRYTPAMIIVVTSVWALSVIALGVLWRRRPHSVLDLWLMVVMCAWIFDIALSAVLNAGRFDLGFYSGRIYGLLASTFVLMVLLLENGMLYARLVKAHNREHQKAAELSLANRDLEAFSYSVSHDLRAPLRIMDGFAMMLERSYGEKLDAEGRRLLGVVRSNGQRMGQLIDDLLAFARLGRQPIQTQSIKLEDLVNQTIEEMNLDRNKHKIDFSIGDLGVASVDPALLKQALTNLIGNAIKFTRNKEPATIEVGCRQADESDAKIYYVKDNGAGFDMRYADKLFGVFQRLHRAEEYEGTGVGLA
ncbi:MAG TPA: MASE4 domain-containing protein, partial [Burkholderiales bacterium]|nr:MASE4 domain-containing protein [Burkholderiales bacterium]